jgi:hypothetical protein
MYHAPTFLLDAAAKIHGHPFRWDPQFEEFSDCYVIQLTRNLQAQAFCFQQRFNVFRNVHVHRKMTSAQKLKRQA